jgi:hypothetical protein
MRGDVRQASGGVAASFISYYCHLRFDVLDMFFPIIAKIAKALGISIENLIKLLHE